MGNKEEGNHKSLLFL